MLSNYPDFLLIRYLNKVDISCAGLIEPEDINRELVSRQPHLEPECRIIQDGDLAEVIPITSEMMGYNDEGEEVWT